MIPIQVKLAVGAVLVIGAFWAGTEWEKGQVAQVEVEEHNEEVVAHNEKTFTLEEVDNKLLAQERELRSELTRSPRHDVSAPCPVGQLTIMRNDKIDRFNSTLFPSED